MCDSEVLLPTGSKLYFCQSCWKDRASLMKASQRPRGGVAKTQHSGTIDLNSASNLKRSVPKQDDDDDCLIPV